MKYDISLLRMVWGVSVAILSPYLKLCVQSYYFFLDCANIGCKKYIFLYLTTKIVQFCMLEICEKLFHMLANEDIQWSFFYWFHNFLFRCKITAFVAHKCSVFLHICTSVW